MIRMRIIVAVVFIAMIAGCSVNRQDAETTRVNTVTVDEQTVSNTTPNDNKTGFPDSISPYDTDPRQSSWQYTGYVIDKKQEKIPAILFVWDVQAEQMNGRSVDDILQIANPNVIWLTTEDVTQADDIHIGDAINVILAPNVNTSFPAQGKLEQMQIVSDQKRISIKTE
ncbi:DUF3221 domain-containing protein [Paenibacillus sp. WLX2291]|uniref:DUF3221 domain-containing protein n=1 Tax=Paenibacillus sp. WLX2291 TaxID=3296934 RepID=UPI003983FBC2